MSAEFLSSRPNNTKWEYFTFLTTQLILSFSKAPKHRQERQPKQITNRQRLELEQLNTRIRNLTRAYLVHKP
ncbi:9473_t:CDS:2, partial [Entrophospora sp. SA101]